MWMGRFCGDWGWGDESCRQGVKRGADGACVPKSIELASRAMPPPLGDGSTPQQR